MFKAEIIADDVDDNLLKLFSFEEKSMLNGRASYTVSHSGNSVKFAVIASDSVALRSVFNAITKIITVYEKSGVALNE